VLVATGRARKRPIAAKAAGIRRLLREAVIEVVARLAQAIVRDGEGATKFITITRRRGRDASRNAASRVRDRHSPLVKTAFFASDPNLGRILAAVGYAGIADLDQTRRPSASRRRARRREGGRAARTARRTASA
jgi:glutamate N-acetyltransferase/amino-acid N-acetyltransferase